MPQFTINREPVGDVVVNTGYVVDLTATTTTSFFVGDDSIIAAPIVPDIASSVFTQRFAGGSGRNMIIENVIDPAIPYGWMKQFKNQLWDSEDGPFKCTVNADTAVLEFSDETNTIFTAPPGSIPIYGRFECSAGVSCGSVGTHEYIVDLGTATGSTVLNFEAYSIPNIFKVEYNGVEVINTGYRGISGTYDGVPVTVAGPGTGSASFNKTTASPTWAKVIVEAPFTNLWNELLPLAVPNINFIPSGTPLFTISAAKTAYIALINYGVIGVSFTAADANITIHNASTGALLSTRPLLLTSNGSAVSPFPFDGRSVDGIPLEIENIWGVAVEVRAGPGICNFPGIYFGLAGIRVDDSLAYKNNNSWEFNLGCPGGASPPYTPPPVGTRITFTGTSTTYGNSLNGSTPFTTQIEYENGFNNTSLSLYCEFNTFSEQFHELSPQLWSDNFLLYAVSIDDLGIATLFDHEDVIAIRAESKLIDPSGTYISTTYGKEVVSAQQGVTITEDFPIAIQINFATPIELYTFIALDIVSGNVAGVRGPFSASTFPANTSTEKYIPISYSDGAGVVNQIHEGTLFWK